VGADRFCILIKEADPTIAFDFAKKEAGDEHGHGGYTGTIAEKHDFTVITRTPRSEAEAEELANTLLEDLASVVQDKWGPAGAIPVTLECRTLRLNDLLVDFNHLQQSVETHLREQNLLGPGESFDGVALLGRRHASQAEWNGPRPATPVRVDLDIRIRKAGAPRVRTLSHELRVVGRRAETFRQDLERLAADQITLATRERIASVRVNEAVWDQSTGRHLGGPKVTHRTRIEVPKAKTETRYVVLGAGTGEQWEHGFPTQAAARAWAEQHIQESHADALAIQAITRRITGEPLVTIRRDVVKSVVPVTITIATASQLAPTTDAWLFFGYASC